MPDEKTMLTAYQATDKQLTARL